MSASGSDDKKSKKADDKGEAKKPSKEVADDEGVKRAKAKAKAAKDAELAEDQDAGEGAPDKVAAYEAEQEEDEKMASKLKSDEVDESLEPFFESDSRATPMTFDKGGFPLYVKLVWVVFLVSVSIYIYVYALPDLTAWGAP